MRWEDEKCPDCGGDIYGTLESLQGVALIIRDGDGDFAYEGYTEICWDAQEIIQDDEGRDCLTCEKGHEWHSKRLEETDKSDQQLPESICEDGSIAK